MKKLLFVVACLVGMSAQAQLSEGTIIYTETMYFELKDKPEGVDEERWEQIKAMIPESRDTKRQLLFNQEATVYKHYKDPNEQVEYDEGRGGMFKMQFERPDEISFVDLKNGTFTEQRDMFGKMFLIEDTVEARKWKIIPEQKAIMGYNCMKAMYEDTSMTVEVWFTPQIPIQAGPMKISGLPGLAMEVILRGEQMRGGHMEIKATTINETLVAEELVRPEKGKKVTNEEFEEIQAKKIEEMREMYGGGKGGRGGRSRIMVGG